MSDQAVLLDIEDGIATITLNKPDMRNALTRDISAGLVDAIDEIEESDEARCVVVQGSGGGFSAGGDVNSMMERMSGEVDLHDAVESIVRKTSEAIKAVYQTTLPTVAKIDGPAFGAGANLAVACDVLLATEDARISFGFRQVGLTMDTGTSYFLPRIVGENIAKELVYTGELVEADRAEDLGLFNHVYAEDEFDEQADELIDDIASGPTVALSNSKRLLRQGLQSNLDQAIHNEAAAQGAVFETDDHEEGATAFMEGRKPDFQGE